MKISCKDFKTDRFEVQKTFRINSKPVDCIIVCEDNIIERDDGTSIGSIFSYTYTVRPNTASRPVLFIYNGGPGSASLWLNLGLFGPKLAYYESELEPGILPPFTMADNDYCLLDICDMVFIDTIGTGYGVLFNEDSKPDIYSTSGDAKALCCFIKMWLTAYDRWQSPKFLVGESYGSIRSAVTADMLSGCEAELNSVGIDGIITLGNAIGCGKGICENNIDKSALILPSLAANSQYHGRTSYASPSEAVSEAKAFAGNDYIKALFSGNKLDRHQKDVVAARLSELIGIDAAWIMKNNLRLDAELYRRKLLEDKGFEIGLYDGRYVMNGIIDLGERDSVGDDPAMASYTPLFTGVFNSCLKNFLGISWLRPYVPINFALQEHWNYDTGNRTSAQSLAAAMRRNPNMRLFFGSGIYDLITTSGETEYAINHMDLSYDKVVVKEYESGHMPYLGHASRKKLTDDIKNFIQKNNQED